MSEQIIIEHCSPTLAGIKTANLFSCTYNTKEELHSEIRLLNRRLSHKSIRIILLKCENNKALIYIYRPAKLSADFENFQVKEILSSLNYPCDNINKCIVCLINKLKNSNDFPHEIGLFLGYPPEDVKGFIENKATKSKCVGCWKVYGDVDKAKKQFMKFEKCRKVYISQFEKGSSVERLTVAV